VPFNWEKPMNRRTTPVHSRFIHFSANRFEHESEEYQKLPCRFEQTDEANRSPVRFTLPPFKGE
jgi:hypothetical protein